jgi:hypothetical protein
MECFLCASTREMVREAIPSSPSFHEVIVAGFLLGTTISQLPSQTKGSVFSAVCENHMCLLRGAVEEAVKVNNGNPGFDAIKPYLLKSIPPRLKQVK